MRRIIVVAAMALAAAGHAHAAETKIGAASSISNQVIGIISGQTTRMRQGDTIYQDEIVETARRSQANLVFEDRTTFTVGPSARAVLDTFVYDPRARSGRLVIDASKGAFRFASGLARKKNFEIRTPVASIGVRGTIFHLFVSALGTTIVALEEGALIVCERRVHRNRKCVTMTRPGTISYVLTSGYVIGPGKWGDYQDGTNFDQAFPYISDDDPYRGDGDDTTSEDNPASPPPPAPPPQDGPIIID